MPVISGEIHPNAKLTAAQVRAIRETYEPGEVTMLQLAERYGVTKQSISNIVSRITWRGLTKSPSAEGAGGA